MAVVRHTAPPAPLLPTGPEWIYEVDWAGVPLVADVDEGTLTLRDVTGRDVTARFPEFAACERVLADGLLVGQAVLLDRGAPSAAALAERLRVPARRAVGLARARPAVLMVDDVLRLYGVDLSARPLADRRAVLDRLDLEGAPRVRLSPTYADGDALRRGAAAQGLGGVVARRRDVPHHPDADDRGERVRVPAGPLALFDVPRGPA